MYTHHQTIFNELLSFLPLKSFEAFVGQHQLDRCKQKFSARNLLVVLMYAQITGKDSLRDIETSLTVLEGHHYHHGIGSIKRSTVAYNNNLYDPKMFEELFYAIIQDIKQFYPNNQFTYYSLDSTTISLALGLCPWAKHRTRKGAVKMHILLDNQNLIPSVINITTGNVADITEAKRMELEQKLEKGDFLVFDRGYWDYGWLMGLDKKGIYFVTRPRKNTDYIVIESKTIGISGVQTEEIVEIFNPLGKTTYQGKLRRIHYISPDDGKEYWFITNNFETDAKYITLLYKKRWEIEIFFKFIKQTLKIKSFLGTSKNAIMNQLWVAMIYYLILCYIKFKTKVKQGLLELSRVFAAGIFIRRKIIDLLGLMPKNIPKLSQRMKRDVFVQLGLF